MATVTPHRRSGGRRSLIEALPAPGQGGHALGASGFGFLDPEEVVALRAVGEVVLLEADFSSFDHPAVVHHLDGHHLPGAVRLHPSYLESGFDRAKYYPNYQQPEDGNLLPARELGRAVERLGIGPGRTPSFTVAARTG